MCDPASIALATAAAAAVTKAASSVFEGYSTAASASYQATVARNNAVLALEKGRIEEQRSRIATGALIGEQRAAYAGSGVDVNVGSPSQVQSSTAALGELDALTIRTNAMRESYNYRAQQAMLRAQAKNAVTAGWIGAAGSLLGGVSDVAGKWAAFKASSPGSAGATTSGGGGG